MERLREFPTTPTTAFNTARSIVGERVATVREHASAIRGEVGDKVGLFAELIRPDGHRIGILEGNQNCNRHCSYCAVPQYYNKATELTLDETFGAIDLLRNERFRLLSYLGGEPFAPFRTKEGITFTDHTIEVVRYASERGMIVNVTTNGDYLPKNLEVMRRLKEAGLDSLTLSLHTFTKSGLERLMLGAQMAAEQGVIPTIQTVMMRETAPLLPGIAAYVARQGVLFSTGIVQTEGDGFAAEQDDSVLPTREQVRTVFEALRDLKHSGFVRTGWTYLKEAEKYYPNSWKCNPKTDTFIKIGAGGKVNVCSRVETGLKVEDLVKTGLQDERWRAEKTVGVEECFREQDGCGYSCYQDAAGYSRGLIHEIPTAVVMLAMKSGKTEMVKRWGRVATGRSERQNPV